MFCNSRLRKENIYGKMLITYCLQHNVPAKVSASLFTDQFLSSGSLDPPQQLKMWGDIHVCGDKGVQGASFLASNKLFSKFCITPNIRYTNLFIITCLSLQLTICQHLSYQRTIGYRDTLLLLCCRKKIRLKVTTSNMFAFKVMFG